MSPRTPSKRKAKGKTVKGWAVIMDCGEPIPWTCEYKASEAVRKYVKFWEKPWTFWRKHGYTCLPVEIRVTGKGSGK